MVPHQYSRPLGLRSLVWCWLRGINTLNWRKSCKRCGFTGMAHYNIVGPLYCMRFKENS